MATDTLIIRLWEETIEDQTKVWRGEVSHVQSGRLIHFQTLADLYQQIAMLFDEDWD